MFFSTRKARINKSKNVQNRRTIIKKTKAAKTQNTHGTAKSTAKKHKNMSRMGGNSNNNNNTHGSAITQKRT